MQFGRNVSLQSPIGRRWVLPAMSILATMIAVATAATDVEATDRDTARFQKILLGRHDGARITALRSVSADFRSREMTLTVVIESLQELSTDARFDRLEKQGLPDLPDGVRMMIDFIGSVDRPEATGALIQMLDCDRLSWTMATIHTLGKHQRHAALDKVVALIDSEHFHDSYGFRFTLARSLKDMNHPDAWDGLAKLFDRVDGQLAHRLDQEFQDVTVEAFDGDAKRFESWQGLVGLSSTKEPAEKGGLAEAIALLNQDAQGEMPLPQKIGLATAPSAVSYAREKRLKPSQYYGIKIYAKRLLFVIDRSGSMKDIVYGQSRMKRAKRELIAAISGLDEQVEFGILLFDEQVRSWRDNLLVATEENKRDAIRFVERLSAGSTTNTYAALRRSLQFDPQLEAIFMLTDGNPTTGQIINQSAILQDILRRNESNNITINTIAIAVEPPMATFLRNLAAPSNGEFREVK